MRNKNLNSFTIEAVSSNGILDNVISAFWREHQYDPFSQSQIIFYFYLIGLAISRNMKMPVKCHTNTVANLLHISSQSILKARTGLFQRGLIDFSKGNGNQDTPRYYLILDPIQWIEKTDEESSTIIENSIKASKKSSSNQNDNFKEKLDNQGAENGVGKATILSNENLNEGSNNPINNNEGTPNNTSNSILSDQTQESNANLDNPIEGNKDSSNGSDVSLKDEQSHQTANERQPSTPMNENLSMRIVDMRVNFLQDETWVKSIHDTVSPFVNISIEDIKNEIVAVFNMQKYDDKTIGNIESWKNGIFDTVCNKYGLTPQPKKKA